MLVQAGSLLLVVRMLGPHEYGAFAGVAALAVTLGTLSTFGMHWMLLGELARDPSRHQYWMARALPTTLACGTLLLLLFLLICTVGLSEADLPLSILLFIGIAETIAQPLFALATFELLARGHVARSQMVGTVPLALRLTVAAGITLLAPAHPLELYAAGYLVASISAVTIAVRVTRYSWPSPKQWRWPGKAEWHEAAGYAVLNATAAGPSELDKTLATKLLPLDDSGVYAAGQRIVSAATLPVIAMMLSALPRLYRESHVQDARTARLLRYIFLTTTGYGLALSFVLLFCAPLVSQLFGYQYTGIERMVFLLSAAVPGMALRMAAGSCLLTLGKPWMRVCMEGAGLLTLILASIALTSKFGIAAMPLALACSEWGMAVIGLYFVNSAFNKLHSEGHQTK